MPATTVQTAIIIALALIAGAAIYYALTARERGRQIAQIDYNNRLRLQRAELQQARQALEHHRDNYAAAMEQMAHDYDHAISQLRAPTDLDLQLIQQMAEKLNLASQALHATQQYSDAKAAKNLADRGHRLLERLRPTTEEAA